MKELIKLLDGAILDFKVDQWYTEGCETCDYGSSYVTEIKIIYKNKSSDTISDDSMYEYGMSMSDIMKVVLNHLDDMKQLKEVEIASFIKDRLENEQGCRGLEII